MIESQVHLLTLVGMNEFILVRDLHRILAKSEKRRTLRQDLAALVDRGLIVTTKVEITTMGSNAAIKRAVRITSLGHIMMGGRFADTQ